MVGVVSDDPTRRMTATASPDPFDGAPAGTKLVFRALPIVASGLVGSHGSPKDWRDFEGTLLMVGFIQDGSLQVHGSAVMVGPGLALASRHVFDGELDDVLAARKIAVCCGVTAVRPLLWDVKTVTLSDASDLVILTLALRSLPPANNEFRVAPITTSYPRIGDKLLVCGYRPAVGGGDQPIPRSGAEVRVEVLVSKGRVVERYPSGRDRLLVPGPAVMLECPSWGGMSGGPVYTAEGRLVGLLTSSVEGQDVSFVSLTWPKLRTEVRPVWPTGLFREAVSLADLAPTLCAIDRPEAVRVARGTTSGEHVLEYSAWHSGQPKESKLPTADR